MLLLLRTLYLAAAQAETLHKLPVRAVGATARPALRSPVSLPARLPTVLPSRLAAASPARGLFSNGRSRGKVA